jgi:nitric oxide synthase oxygenase domain/subunit
MQFLEAESAMGRCVHMRWSWIAPPMGGSTTPVFHVDEDQHPDLPLRPSLGYQPPAWRAPEG